jgi:hypothetical protein
MAVTRSHTICKPASMTDHTVSVKARSSSRLRTRVSAGGTQDREPPASPTRRIVGITIIALFAPRSRGPLLELLTSLPLHLAKLSPVAAPSLSSRLKLASSEPFTFKTDRVCEQERFSLNSIDDEQSRTWAPKKRFLKRPAGYCPIAGGPHRAPRSIARF